MKKLATLFCSLLCCSLLSAAPIPVSLGVTIDDKTDSGAGHTRTPVAIPEVSLDGYTLLFITPCDGCTLRLLDEDGDVAYTIVIPTGTTTLTLSTTLEGDYELQIIRGSWYFYGDITL